MSSRPTPSAPSTPATGRALNVSGLLALAGTAFLVIAAVLSGSLLMTPEVGADPSYLEGPSAFESIEDPAERSKALFVEASKVLLHPRCVNCHPAGEVPLQGEQGELHEPRVLRGADGDGVPGLHCGTCHTTENFDPGGVPGAPHWKLAPASMAWEGVTLRQLCEQLKDPERAHMSLEEVVTHMAEDPLVAWAWDPGEGRQPPPGDQKMLGDLIAAWVETGAECPAD